MAKSLEEHLLYLVADDYEDVDTIVADLASGLRVPIIDAERSSILDALSELIRKGLVSAYAYDQSLGSFVSVDDSQAKYYHATSYGRALVDQERGAGLIKSAL